MSNLIISEQEWLEAERFFNDEANKNAVKMSRKKNLQVQHSFIKVSGTLYGMAVHDYIGTGSLGKVKNLQTRDGKWVNEEELIVKIEARGLRDTLNDSYVVMDSIGYVKGQAALIKDKASNLMKLSPENTIVSAQRLYTVIKKRKGHELFNVLIDHQDGKSILPLSLRLKIAIEICRKLQALHDIGIIHRDIKPENIMVAIDLKNNTAHVDFIDFDFSILIDEEEAFVITPECAGSPAYIAPECLGYHFVLKAFLTENDIPEKDEIYVSLKNDILEYVVWDPQGKMVCSTLKTSPKKISIEDTIVRFRILTATTKKGHTANNYKYSFASDVYAYGCFMPHLLSNAEFDCSAMLASKPKDRITLQAVQTQLEAALILETQRELAYQAASTLATMPEREPEPVLSPIHNSPAKLTPQYQKHQQTQQGEIAAKRKLGFDDDPQDPKENMDSPQKGIK